MKNYKESVIETVKFIKEKTGKSPKIGLMTGTGLGGSVDSLKNAVNLDYGDIPNFPVSTVESHAGKLVFGEMEGKEIVAMQGRFHLYEGYSPIEVTFPIRVMQELGVEVLIVTNAAGGLNLSFYEGDIMIIEDHINLTGENPLIGPNEDSWGVRFPDMVEVYDARLAEVAESFAKKEGIPVRKGVYVGLKGPSLETRAEMRYLKTIGADVVGFSTIQEVIAGVHAGMRILGLSTVTNINNPDRPENATLEAIVEVANKAAGGLEKVIREVVRKL